MNDFAQKFQLPLDSIPAHIGIIMDGNGRWAKSRLLPRIAGHKKGVERVREITEFCGKIGLYALTLYAFSDENWRRPEDEVNGLMTLLRWYLRSDRKTIISNNVRFSVIGDRLKLSSDILKLIEELEKDTKNATGMNLQIALSYGSRGEILRAMKRYFQSMQNSPNFMEDLDEAQFSQFLDTQGLPDVDLLIRTSGEQRVSNFLLWQAAYAELHFEDSYWPDFSVEILVKILKEFGTRERRFGLTSEQIQYKKGLLRGSIPYGSGR